MYQNFYPPTMIWLLNRGSIMYTPISHSPWRGLDRHVSIYLHPKLNMQVEQIITIRGIYFTIKHRQSDPYKNLKTSSLTFCGFRPTQDGRPYRYVLSIFPRMAKKAFVATNHFLARSADKESGPEPTMKSTDSISLGNDHSFTN